MSFLTFRAIFLATLIALALSLPLARFSRRVGLMDTPGSAPHKKHPAPIPLAGGPVIIMTLVIAAVLENVLGFKSVWSILLPSLIVFIFGVIDDRRGLSAPWKLLGQMLGTGLMILLGVQIHLFDQYPWLNIAITVLWMIGITNAYNFVDSMDGLANGLACLAAAFFMLVTFDSGQGELSVFSALLFGACVGIYYFTFPPARFFLGDSGAQLLGFLLAGLAIAYTPLGFLRIQSWYIPILLMGVPIFDTTLIVVSRLRRHKPVYRAGQDHTYHRLVKLGLDTNRATLSMQFMAGFLGCLAFITLTLPPLAANIIFFACIAAGFLGISLLDSKRVWPI
jgi:UDP-GlcNAc:undecaprenyl-phosphate GlcNAc-1-phosphate transferase